MKAFKKNELATFVQLVDRSTGAFAFQTVRVMSCGKVKMTLQNESTEAMMGADFFPGIGFDSGNVNWAYFEEKCPGRPRHHMVSYGTFKLMTVHEARAFCLKLSAEWLAAEVERLEHCKATGSSEAYRNSIQRDIDAMKANEPAFLER